MPLAAGQTLSFYEILGPLGAGGMGEVFRAHDRRLGRDVAIKVLPGALREDPQQRARFLREARAVAQLAHPNIAQILDVGESDGFDFIVFELVEGETLANALGSRSLGLEEVVELALPLADALTHAHERGIVHRDLKPANVMLSSGGHPKLLDFGLAKVTHGGNIAEEAPSALTMEGAVFGTPAAMSPEQALGRKLDARSDVFSFGSLLYEMACGRAAFSGSTVMEVIDSIIHEEPPPLNEVRAELPEAFAAIVSRALRKEPGERYQAMAELAAELRRFKRDTSSGPQPARPARRRGPSRARWLLGGLAVAAAVAAVLAVLGGRGGAPVSPAATPSLVAVMYFDNLTDPDDADHHGSMFARLLDNELAASRELSVVSQQRLFDVARQLGDREGRVDRSSASAIAERAGLQTMIVGEVARMGGQLVANAAVIDVESGQTLASHRVEGSSEQDMFAMARRLGERARQSLVGDEDAARSLPLTDSVPALRAFVAGEEELQQSNFAQAVGLFDEAVRLDPGFAMAHYRRALSGIWRGDQVENLRALERALEHADRLPSETRRTLAATQLFLTDRLSSALPLLDALVVEYPENKDLHYLLGEVRIHSSVVGDSELALRAFERVLELDPQHSLVMEHIAFALVNLGRIEEAAQRLEDWALEFPVVVELSRSELARRSGPTAAWPVAARLELDGEVFPLYPCQLEIAQEDWRALKSFLEEDVESFLERLRTSVPNVSLQCLWLGGVTRASAFKGRFDRFEHLATRVATLGLNGHDGVGESGRSEIRTLQAKFALLVGDADAAREALRLDRSELPDAPRRLHEDVSLSLRLGDREQARTALEALDRSLELNQSPLTRFYRDAALAEWHLYHDEPASSRRLLEHVVAEFPPFGDGYVYEGSYLPVFQDALARACSADGDTRGAMEALRALVESSHTRSSSPFEWVPALFKLGQMEIDIGRGREGRALLQRFLDYWGDADRQIPMVSEAREILGR